MNSKQVEVELRRLHGRYRLDVESGDLLGALTIREQIGRLVLSEIVHVIDALHTVNAPLNADELNTPEEVPF